MSVTPEAMRAQLIAAALAAKVPLAAPDPTSTPFDSLDSAASAFKKQIDPANHTEQSGVFYGTPDGKYQSSIPVSQKEHDRFALRAQIAKGSSLGAIFHNHPGDDERAQVFSPEDIQTATQLKVPSYVMFQDGSIRKFVPGTTKTRNMRFPGDRFDTKVADGDPITDVANALAAK